MFAPARKGWIGVDLGAGAIKAAQLVRRGNRYEMIEAAAVVRQAGAPSACDEIRGAVSIGERFAGTAAAGVLNMQSCQFHALQLAGPVSNAAILRELSAQTLHNWRQRTFDSWLLGEPVGGGSSAAQVGVISTPTDAAKQAADDFQNAGLDCRQLDAAPMALARAADLMFDDRATSVAVLDWGFRSVTFCTVRNRQPLYVRPLKRCAFAVLAADVAKMIECSREEAIGMLMRRGFAFAKGAKRDAAGMLLEETCKPFADQLLSETRRTLDYLQTHRRGQQPAGIILLGVGACQPGVADWLAQELDTRVVVWRPDHTRLKLPADLSIPTPLLAPAIAASALAWEKR